MVLHRRSVPLALNLLNGEKSGLAIGRMFAIAVIDVAKPATGSLMPRQQSGNSLVVLIVAQL